MITDPSSRLPRGAILDSVRAYRYLLWYDNLLFPPAIAPYPKVVTWVMLNPSTADETEDDPTIRRCIGFSRAWGFDTMEVVNLFSLRSPNPVALRKHAQPVGGRDALSHAWDSILRADRIVVAWGANPMASESPVYEWLGGGSLFEGKTFCLGHTRGGQPKHPLYLPADTELEPWT